MTHFINLHYRRSTRWSHLIFTLLAFIFLGGCTSNEASQEEEEENPMVATCSNDYGIDLANIEPFPGDKKVFDYPNYSIPVAHKKGGTQRDHGWKLFAGLMTKPALEANKGLPWIYLTWPTATQAFTKVENPSGLGSALESNFASAGTKAQELNFLETSNFSPRDSINTTPPTYVIPSISCKLSGQKENCDTLGRGGNGKIFQNNGDVLIAGVVYDKSSYDWIRNKGLYDFEVLKKMLVDSTNAGKEMPYIPPFPETSIVLKPMLWPVKASGYTPLPIFQAPCYDNSNCPPIDTMVNKYIGPEIKTLWNQAVAITTSTPVEETTSVPFLYDVYTDSSKKTSIHSTFDNAPVVSIDEFFSFHITKDIWDNMDCVDKAIINQSSNWIYNEDFNAGDYLVLVAMHIITKELDNGNDWTFQSVWWDNGTGGTYPRDYMGGPSKEVLETVAAKGVDTTAMRNYQLISTYGQTVREQRSDNFSPGQKAGDWPVAYNPYIELAAAHPIETNCRNCHIRGAFPHSTTQSNALPEPLQTNISSYLVK
ncbi:MAG TPA: hypothetical protein DCR93_08620, partial [Cytophagales bacterium]|nr:hypothetical protein [Cytophagales bacterium]